MIKLKLLSAGLAAVMLTTPVLAREHHSKTRRVAKITPATRYVDSQGCQRAPRVGAFATQPWTNGPPCEPTPGY
jgi:hypothetical protein